MTSCLIERAARSQLEHRRLRGGARVTDRKQLRGQRRGPFGASVVALTTYRYLVCELWIRTPVIGFTIVNARVMLRFGGWLWRGQVQLVVEVR